MAFKLSLELPERWIDGSHKIPTPIRLPSYEIEVNPQVDAPLTVSTEPFEDLGEFDWDKYFPPTEQNVSVISVVVPEPDWESVCARLHDAAAIVVGHDISTMIKYAITSERGTKQMAIDTRNAYLAQGFAWSDEEMAFASLYIDPTGENLEFTKESDELEKCEITDIPLLKRSRHGYCMDGFVVNI